MVKNFKSSISSVFSLLLVLLLSSCAGGVTAGLNSYQSPDGRYGFLYPTGWSRVAVTGGPKVVYHDLINSDETLSLVISNVDNDIDLKEIGTPEEVGQRLMSEVIAPEGSGREVDLINARDREFDNHTFYDLEYVVHLEDRDRHELATVVVDRGSLYTFATGTNEVRWPKVKNLFDKVISSFTFLI